ncbi:dynamin family protein [Ferroacidibacillus organovorans]|uniref:Dynamin N-terminal domain-containing protein n=1 Tax=Ferroacidibacillus organovorans TaxID=1765683 RepID=A0A124IVQ0_9BACL|nr:dynamin family protein [Ferroacidibacillus organovorans]KUO94954.1 hypothetical protein ATW55_04785 [Ferroacidibacillus organovorans]
MNKETLRIAERLARVSTLLANTDLESLRANLSQRAERLLNQESTIAVFGAFSAGKSSLINALVLRNLLPVSPNPTTASINRIMPPTDEFPHETVRVFMKSAAQVQDEVANALQHLGLPVVDLSEIPRVIASIVRSELQPEKRAYDSFLRSLARGLTRDRPFAGEVRNVPLSEFPTYVAREDRAVWVERIDLYLDSPFAKLGVTLVDTPGSNSIHARHTDLAFQFMRDADATVFVTYYNHAFAKPDRSFLRQLGMVKDALDTDSMLFVINASDLAATPDETGQVVSYVRQELQKLGVRTPQIYPLSSQLAMFAAMIDSDTFPEEATGALRKRLHLAPDEPLPSVEEMKGRSGITPFYEALVALAVHRLRDESHRRAKAELTRAASRLEAGIAALGAQIEQGDTYQRKRLEESYAFVAQMDEDLAIEAMRLKAEGEELFHHALQRVRFALPELSAGAFHVSTLRSGSRDEADQAYRAWRSDVAERATQEARATSLRLLRMVDQGRGRRLQAHLDFCAREGLVGQETLEKAPDYPVPTALAIDSAPDVERAVQRAVRDIQAFIEGAGRSQLAPILEAQAVNCVESYFLSVLRGFIDVHSEQSRTERADYLMIVQQAQAPVRDGELRQRQERLLAARAAWPDEREALEGFE